MKTYDWIVVGAGITGAALAYELVNKGCKVLLLEQYATPHNATRYSYGGLAFWSGTTPLTRQLCDEGIARHRILSEELNADTEFRELDLLLTISADTDPASVAASYTRFAIRVCVARACRFATQRAPYAYGTALAQSARAWANALFGASVKLWNQSGFELVPPILDAGAVQFRYGSFRLGQISRAITDPHANVDSKQSEAELRASIGKTLPKLNNLPGTWHHCLVSFSSDALPLIGLVPQR